jgi:hypothetical protein
MSKAIELFFRLLKLLIDNKAVNWAKPMKKTKNGRQTLITLDLNKIGAALTILGMAYVGWEKLGFKSPAEVAMAKLLEDVALIKGDVGSMKSDIASVKTNQETLSKELKGMNGDIAGIERRVTIVEVRSDRTGGTRNDND